MIIFSLPKIKIICPFSGRKNKSEKREVQSIAKNRFLSKKSSRLIDDHAKSLICVVSRIVRVNS